MSKVEPIGPFLEPLRKSVTVPTSPRESFEIFTARFADWWPVEQYSISRQRTVRCEMEQRAGGEVYEVRDDGARFAWGKVVRWDPPHGLVLSWHPGRSPEQAQEVELRFTDTGTGTLVELEHRDWARLGDGAAEVRDGYERGWDHVLGVVFAGACSTGT